MAKTKRDDMCPCGSGENYQRCCGNLQNLPDPQSHNATMERQMRSIEKLIADKEFDSFEDLNAFLQESLTQGDTTPAPLTAAEEAQELVYQAWESPTQRQRERLAKKALEIDADCVDAHIIFAEHAPDPRSALKRYQMALEAGERNLGPKAFQEDVGHFWGLMTTRPYMRARRGLAQRLWAVGDYEAAVEHFQAMLKLNPGDNQGVRYELLSCLIQLEDLGSIESLFEGFEDEITAIWMFTKPLVHFLRHGDTVKGRALLSEALEENPYVADYLLGRKRIPRTLPDYIGLGDENEAISYVSEFGLAWRNYPRALAWLESVNEPEGIVIEFPRETNGENDTALDDLVENGLRFAPDLDLELELEEKERIEPSMREWEALYKAAIEFKKKEPWRWLDYGDIFALENPSDNQAGYCTVMGSGGREFGLAVFMGDEGFESYRRLQSGEIDPDSFEAAAMMRSLSLILSARDDLDDEDYEVTRSLGLRFRGKKAWPLFRSVEPGWLPWFLDRDEARFLALALEMTLEVLDRVKDQMISLVNYEDKDLVLTLRLRRSIWRDEWKRPPTPEPEKGLSESLKAPRLDRVRLSSGKPSGSWEIDVFPAPGALASTSGRLYYPHISIAVDRPSGVVIGFDVTGPTNDAHSTQEVIVNLFERVGALPREVSVSTETMRDILEPVTNVLGIKVRTGILPSLEEAKADLVDMMMDEY